VDIEGCQPNTPGAQNCDVILAQASDFGDPDASVPPLPGGAGSGSNPPPGGNAGSGSNPPPGSAGSGSGGAPPVGGSAGSSSVAGSGSGGGAGGAGSAGSSSGGGNAGSGNAGSGNAGTGGGAGSGSAGTGSGGTGSTSNFDLDSCNLQNTAGCEEFACETACPAGGAGNFCRSNCRSVVHHRGGSDVRHSLSEPVHAQPVHQSGEQLRQPHDGRNTRQRRAGADHLPV